MKWIMIKRGNDIFQLYYNDDSDKPEIEKDWVVIEYGEDQVLEEQEEQPPIEELPQIMNFEG